MKFLGCTTDFPTWGSGKEAEIPQGFGFGGQWHLIIELPPDWGNRLLEDTNKPVHIRSQEKGAVTPEETESDLPVSVQESLADAWVKALTTTVLA